MRGIGRNPGHEFEDQVQRTCNWYQREAVLRAHKVAPPVRVIGAGKRRRVILLENPFLDFCGTWSVMDGQALHFECKVTKSHRLPIHVTHSGISVNQASAMYAWSRAGAAAFMLWRFDLACVLVPACTVWAANQAGARSLVFGEMAYPVQLQLNRWLFAEALEKAHMDGAFCWE